MSAAPPIIIIIGGHAYHFANAVDAARFASAYAENGNVPDQADQ